MGSLIQVLNHRSWFDYSAVMLYVLLFAFFHPGEPQILGTMVCLCRYPMRGRHSNESLLVCRFYLIWLEFMFFCALFANLPDKRTNSASFFTSRHHLFNPKTTNVCAVFLLTLFSRFSFCTSFCFDKIQQSWRPLNVSYRFFFHYYCCCCYFFPFDVMLCAEAVCADYVGNQMKNDSMNYLERMNSLLRSCTTHTKRRLSPVGIYNFICEFVFDTLIILIAFDFAISQWHISLKTGFDIVTWQAKNTGNFLHTLMIEAGKNNFNNNKNALCWRSWIWNLDFERSLIVIRLGDFNRYKFWTRRYVVPKRHHVLHFLENITHHFKMAGTIAILKSCSISFSWIFSVFFQFFPIFFIFFQFFYFFPVFSPMIFFFYFLEIFNFLLVGLGHVLSVHS